MTYHEQGVELPLELKPPRIVERPPKSGVFVRLDDSYLRAIVYIGVKRPGDATEIDTHGTGFLVSHEGHSYIVTAAHVAVDFDDGPMDVRLNREDNGLGGIVSIDTAKWHYHPTDKTVDVAVMPFETPTWARVVHHPSKSFATEFKIGTKDFGAGDLAYVVGIFNKLRGTGKNVPFVHTGHIASMGQGESVTTEYWWLDGKEKSIEINGYLVQVTTLPESSGSPVFVRRSLKGLAPEPGFKPPEGAKPGDKINVPMVRAWRYGSVWLLGLWHGHWTTEERNVIVGDDMGICVPVPRILEVLNSEELKRMRQESDQLAKSKNAITQLSKSKSMSGDDILRAALNTAPTPRVKPKAKSAKRGRAGVNKK